MDRNEVQLSPIDKVRYAAEANHLRWSQYAFRWTDKRKLIVAPHIEIIASIFDDMLAGRRKRVLINIPPRHGKAIDCDTPMLTKRGWVAARDVVVGDYFVAVDGSWTEVLGVFPQGVTEAYAVTVDDGGYLVTSGDHRWGVLHRDKALRYKGSPDAVGKTGPKTKKFMVKTTLELKDNLSTSEGKPKWCVPRVATPDGVDPDIEPYLLGCWLGDGHSQTAAITSMDEEIVAEFASAYELRKHKHQSAGAATTYQVVGGFQQKLRALNILRNKHIPQEVFAASKEYRFAVLQGLLDTDGYHASQSGVTGIAMVREPLIADIHHLIISLGWRAIRRTGWNSEYQKNVYQLDIQTGLTPFRLPRKIAAYEATRNNFKVKSNAVRHRWVSSIQQVADRETVCFAVAHEDHLFAAGHDLVVTHNTELGVKSLSARIFAQNPSARIMHTSYSDELVQKNSRNVKAVLTSEQFKAAFLNTRMAADSFAKKHWNTTEGGEFHAVSTSSAVTGFECGRSGDPFDGMLIIDDPEKASGMSSPPYRSQMKDVVGQTIGTRLNHDDTPVLVIQQRTHPDDTSHWLMSGGTGDHWDVLCFAAISETGRPPEHYNEYTHANIIQYQIDPGALWEERKPLEALYRIRDAQEDLDADEPRGKRVFAAQYQQNPSDVSISLYDEAWLEPFDQQSLPWSLDRMTVRIDTAQKALGKNDQTGMVTFGHDRREGNELFILDVDRARKEFPDLVEWIVAHCKRLWLLQTGNLKFTQITIEDANIGAALLAVLKLRLRTEKIFVRVELTKKYGSKFDRALEATPYFQQGRVRICDERLTYTHKKRPEETELEGIKAFRDEFKTFNEADTHTSDDTLDPVVWEVVSKWGGAKKNTRFR